MRGLEHGVSSLSKRWNHEYWSCKRKYAFDSWSAAEAVCRELREDPAYERKGRGLFAYRCVWNDSHWHIGHEGRWTLKKRRKAELTLKRKTDSMLEGREDEDDSGREVEREELSD